MLVKKFETENKMNMGSTSKERSSISDRASLNSDEHGNHPHFCSRASIDVWRVLSGDGALNLAKLVMLPWYNTSGLCIIPLPCRECLCNFCSWGLLRAGWERVSLATSPSSVFPLALTTCSVL